MQKWVVSMKLVFKAVRVSADKKEKQTEGGAVGSSNVQRCAWVGGSSKGHREGVAYVDCEVRGRQASMVHKLQGKEVLQEGGCASATERWYR